MQAISIELGISQIRGGIIVAYENGIKFTAIDPKSLISSKFDIKDTLARIRAMADGIRKRASLEWPDISGIGVSIPNSINRFGVIGEGTMLRGWDNLPIRQMLQNIFPEIPDAQIIAFNDTHSAALGEFVFGEGRGYTQLNLVHFTVTAGIGIGTVLDGRLYTGTSGYAGEIGHVVIDPSGDLCPGCKRQYGCLETVASGSAIAQRAGELIKQNKGLPLLKAILGRLEKEGSDTDEIAMDDGGGAYEIQINLENGINTISISARDVVSLAQKGDEETKAIIEEAGTGLGKAIVQILHIINPSMITVGGIISPVNPIYLKAAEEWVYNHALRPARVVTPILPSGLQDLGSMYGAAAGVFATLDALH